MSFMWGHALVVILRSVKILEAIFQPRVVSTKLNDVLFEVPMPLCWNGAFLNNKNGIT